MAIGVVDIFASIGTVATAGGVGAATSVGIFRLLGKSWLEHKFKEELERLKHLHQTEVEKLRHEINSLYSRISKIHEKEFEVLPQSWNLLHHAYGQTFATISAFKQYPDLNRMSADELEEFLLTCRLRESQKARMREAQDKLKFYQSESLWFELSDAKKAHTEFHNYIILNSIFMTADLQKKFRDIDDAIGAVLIKHEVGHQANDRDMIISSSKSTRTLTDQFHSIETAVQERLRYAEA